MDLEVADVLARGELRLAVDDQGDIGSRAADIQAHAVRDMAQIGDVGRADHPRGGARQDHLYAIGLAMLGAHHAAVGLGDLEVHRHPALAQRALQAFQVMRDARLHIAADGGGQRTFVFADDRPDLMRAGHEHSLQRALQDRLDLPFMGRVAVGMQQRDDHAFAAGLAQRLGRRQHAGLVHRRDHAAIGAQPFVHAEHPVARNQRRRPLGHEVVHVGNLQPADVQHVLEVARGDQRQLQAAALHHGVDPTVVPCVKYDTWTGSRPCRAFSCSMPARTSLPGASGREKTFRV